MDIKYINVYGINFNKINIIWRNKMSLPFDDSNETIKK